MAGRLREWGMALVLGIALVASAAPQAMANKPLPKAVVLRGESLTLQGPAGYCPDPETLRQSDGAAVVLFGRCVESELIAPAVISLTLGRPGSAALMLAGGADMASFFSSEQGRKLLSKRGRSADVEVMTALTVGMIFLFKLREKDEGIYWRGMSSLLGRTVSVKASGPDLSEEESRSLVEKTIAALKKANPDTMP